MAVVGGGNTAVEEALFLTNHATKVTLIHRRDRLRAESILQDRLFRNPKIAVVWDSVVEEVLRPARREGGHRPTAPRPPHGREPDLAIEGVFVAIGHDPATALFRGQLDLDAAGYIAIAPWSTATSLPGVFAAGDVADAKFRQAVTAAGMGCMAALEAEKFLAEHAPDPASGPARARRR